MVALMEHFRAEGAGRESEWARQRRWFIKARNDQQRREDHQDKLDASVTALSAAVTVATELQVQQFKLKLDSYDTATVAALIEGQELLDAVNERLADILARAHILEDGRRVFKTEDGTQVFDEHGVEVGHDEVDPDAIDPIKPTWEAFSAEVELKEHLTQQRTDILEFQEKVDAACKRVNAGEISEEELEALDVELLDIMPDTVRAHAGIEPRQLDQQISQSAPTPSTPSAETAAPAPM